jgi:hypothetical protein
MKMLMKLLFFFIIILISGCGSSSSVNQPEAPILTGKITRNMLENDQYSWFKLGYDSFNPDTAVLVKIKEKIDNFNVLIYMGTWCSDSKREVPKFFKITDKIIFTKIDIIGLDKKKKSPEGSEANYKIEKVPTFIFLNNSKEIGRIIESPQKTLEEDILNIIQTK